jgi:AraC family transcriptional regulator
MNPAFECFAPGEPGEPLAAVDAALDALGRRPSDPAGGLRIAGEHSLHGDGMAKFFHLASAPSLTTRSLSRAQLAVTRLASDTGVGRTELIPVEKAYVVGLQLRDLLGVRLWKDDRVIGEGPFPEGSVSIVHLEEEPVADLSGAFDFLQYYVPEIVFDELADECGAPRISAFDSRAADVDPVMLQLGRALLPALADPESASRLFFDHIAFASYSHLASRYGLIARRLPSRNGGLSPSQERVAKELLTADLAEEPAIADVARACGLPMGRFVRAFRQSTGEPPYRWLRHFRVERAKELLFHSALSLAQIAYDCGFSDQSHFTRVFCHATGTAPGAWRRARRG